MTGSNKIIVNSSITGSGTGTGDDWWALASGPAYTEPAMTWNNNTFQDTTFESLSLTAEKISTMFPESTAFPAYEKNPKLTGWLDPAWKVKINQSAYTTSDTWQFVTDWSGNRVETPKEARARRRSLPMRKRTALLRCAANEDKARQLLLRFIGPMRFRKYLRDGFVSYKGKSGKLYQIFPSNQMTKVWEYGELIESLCVCLEDQMSGGRHIPPTDAIIMRMLMLEHSEELFRSKCNVFSRRQVRAAA